MEGNFYRLSREQAETLDEITSLEILGTIIDISVRLKRMNYRMTESIERIDASLERVYANQREIEAIRRGMDTYSG